MRLSSHSFRPWWILALWLALAPFWIQKESLWIDEAVSAIVTLSPSLGGVWSEISRIHATEMHLPAYHYYLWLVARGWGHHEAILRAANLPWMLLGFVSLILAIRTRSASKADCWMALFLVTNPFLFYYANEVRPYAMQFGLASLAFAGMIRVLPDPRPSFWAWTMAGGATLLAWTTIYGLAWWLVLLLFWLGNARRPKKEVQEHAITVFLVAGGLSALLFHAWILFKGAKASPVGETGLTSLSYAFCEWSGGAGFLPGRSQLRSGTLPQANELGLAGLTAGLTLLLLTVGYVQSRNLPGGRLFPSAWVFPSFGVLASGFLRKFRLVGRHFTPVAPSFFWFLSLGPQSRPRWHWTRLSAIFLLGLWVFSNYRLATGTSYRKDDYRGVARYILEHRAPAEVVWWAADSAAARFYGVQPVLPLMSSSEDSLQTMPRPTWVVLSKPDIYDGNSSIRKFLHAQAAEKMASYQAFEIYRCSPKSF